MSFKKYRSSNSPTYMEHKEEKIKETIDDEEYVVFCDDEFVKGLEILMDKANKNTSGGILKFLHITMKVHK